MLDFTELLRSEFSEFGVLSEVQLHQLKFHYELLSRWNSKINLTRITEIKESVQLNYCESLFLAKTLPPGPLKIVDVGSGAGFPGIPIAVFRPDSQVDLVESHQRKASFLREATLSLGNVEVIAGRAEQCNRGYDWLVSRAVLREDVLKLGIAEHFALLAGGSVGIKLPWGRDRRLLMS